jgi:uncharacterized protein YkwD
MPRRILLAAMATIAVASVLAAFTAQPGASTASTPLDTEERLFVSLINQYRQQNGLNTLTIDANLPDAVEWMSTDMGVNNYFSHTDSLGRDPFVRMNAFGYNYNTWKGENIAAGTSSAQAAFDLWKGSAGHNANMLNPDYKVMGIARVATPGSDYGWYWTNDFGGYVAPGTPTASPGTPSPTTSPAPDSDADGDGFTYAVEMHLGTNPNDACGNPNLAVQGSPSLAWPADLHTASANRVDILDIATFIAPVRRFGTSPGETGYDRRCDFVPGKGGFAADINITDIGALTAAAPPMFGFQRAFNGPSCTP